MQNKYNETKPLKIVLIVVRVNEPVREKSNNLGTHQVRHKPGCTDTYDDYRLEILYLGRRGIVLSV